MKEVLGKNLKEVRWKHFVLNYADTNLRIKHEFRIFLEDDIKCVHYYIHMGTNTTKM